HPPRSQMRTGAVASITAPLRRAPRSDRGPEVPLAGNALQDLRPAIVEPEVRTDDQVLHGAGDEHLAGPGQGAHPRADVDPDAGDVLAPPLDLAGVQAGADVDAQRAHRVAHRSRGPHASARTVE